MLSYDFNLLTLLCHQFSKTNFDIMEAHQLNCISKIFKFYCFLNILNDDFLKLLFTYKLHFLKHFRNYNG